VTPLPLVDVVLPDDCVDSSVSRNDCAAWPAVNAALLFVELLPVAAAELAQEAELAVDCEYRLLMRYWL
jgi:hypothetical protein